MFLILWRFNVFRCEYFTHVDKANGLLCGMLSNSKRVLVKIFCTNKMHENAILFVCIASPCAAYGHFCLHSCYGWVYHRGIFVQTVTISCFTSLQRNALNRDKFIEFFHAQLTIWCLWYIILVWSDKENIYITRSSLSFHITWRHSIKLCKRLFHKFLHTLTIGLGDCIAAATD